MASITAENLKSALPSTCTISTPGEGDTPHSFLSKRWMTLGRSTLPAAAIVPSTEEDVVAVVKYAAANGLKVLPQNGACGGVVITDNKTLLLDMEKFRGVTVDTDAKTVTFGGGALTRDVQPAVTEKGFYSGWPNLGCVGMVGNILGGGINLVQGTKGHTCDNLISARLVTGSGSIVTVAETSSGSEKALFNQLKGAGAGFGVVVSMTMRIYPQAELALTGGSKIPETTAFFSEANFDAAGLLWDKFIALDEGNGSNMALLLTVGPPNTPMEGKPLVMANASYAGPEADAKAAFEPFSHPAIASKMAMPAMASTSDLRTMNDTRDKMMTKGTNQDCFNGLMKQLSGASIVRAAHRWAEFVKTHGAGVGRTMTVFHPMHSESLMKADRNNETFMCHRDRDFMVQAVAWDAPEENLEAVRQYCRDVVNIARSEDSAEGVSNAILAGNARVEADMTEILTPEKIEALKKTKREWDPKGVFWNPAADGWVC